MPSRKQQSRCSCVCFSKNILFAVVSVIFDAALPQDADSLCAGEKRARFAVVSTPFYEAFSLVIFALEWRNDSDGIDRYFQNDLMAT